MKSLFSVEKWRKVLLSWWLTIMAVGMLAGCASHSTASDSAIKTTATPTGNEYYRVQRGDNLYRIGLKYGLNVDTLMRWNQLKNADAIEVGQLIRVKMANSRNTGVSSSHQSTNIHKTTSQKPATTPKSTTVNSGGMPNVSLLWPVKGQLITKFNGQTQKGIDIAAARGTPIKAAAAGTVQYAGEELRGYGKLILIKHSGSTMTAYAHNDRLLVRNGQQVSAGQQIATMGNSGGVSSVRLHFEVRVNSQAVDPLRYLPQ